MTMERAKSRIRKMLNLAADDAAADGEVENALRFARRLMLEHNLSEDDIKPDAKLDPHEIAAREEYGSVHTQVGSSKVSRWEDWLAGAVALLFGTVGYYIESPTIRKVDGRVQFNKSGKPRWAGQVVFYGPLLDVIEAEDTFKEWLHIIAAMGRLRYGGVYRGSGRSYCEGFALELVKKLKAIQKDEQRQIDGPQSTALVLVGQRAVMDAKRDAGDKWLRGSGIRLVKRSVPFRFNDGQAYSQGKQDGASADFTRGTTKRLDA